MRFTFVAKYKAIEKIPFFTEGKSRNGNRYVKMKFLVEAGNDSAVVEAFGTEQSELNLISNAGEKLVVDWGDRFEESVVRNCARRYNTRFTVDGQSVVKSFVSQYDQILYLKEMLPKVEGNVTIMGEIEKSYYGGKQRTNYMIRHVFESIETEKQGLLFEAEVIYNKEGIDMAEWESKKIIRVNGYTEQYIDKDHKKALVPQQFVLNASRLKPDEDPKHKLGLKLRLSCLEPKGKKYFKMLWYCKLLSGQEEVEFTEADLTPFQRDAIDCGEYTLEDCRPRNQIRGEKITEFRLMKPNVAEYKNGPIEFGDAATAEALIYQPPVAANLVQNATQSAAEKELDLGPEDIDDLFG